MVMTLRGFRCMSGFLTHCANFGDVALLFSVTVFPVIKVFRLKTLYDLIIIGISGILVLHKLHSLRMISCSEYGL